MFIKYTKSNIGFCKYLLLKKNYNNKFRQLPYIYEKYKIKDNENKKIWSQRISILENLVQKKEKEIKLIKNNYSNNISLIIIICIIIINNNIINKC